MKKLFFIMVAGMVGTAAQAATIDFGGYAQAGNITGIPWVIAPGPTPTFMWGSVDTGNSTATGQSGFTSLNSLNISLLTWTFGDLELSADVSPGPSSPGYEVYSNVNASVVPFVMSYNGSVWATGNSIFLRDDVSDINDLSATGTGRFQLTAPGVDSTFFNEVMSLTANTGLFDVSISAFNPVNNAGLFSSTGVITTVPEPGLAAVALGLGVMGMVAGRWGRKHP